VETAVIDHAAENGLFCFCFLFFDLTFMRKVINQWDVLNLERNRVLCIELFNIEVFNIESPTLR
jgi:hypothetical protein